MKPDPEKTLKMIGKAAREFSVKELMPSRTENDSYPHTPFFDTILQKAYALDFFHLTRPIAFGGMGLGIQALCRLLQGLSLSDASLATLILTHSAAQEAILASGAEQQLTAMMSSAHSFIENLLAFPLYTQPDEMALDALARERTVGTSSRDKSPTLSWAMAFVGPCSPPAWMLRAGTLFFSPIYSKTASI